MKKYIKLSWLLFFINAFQLSTAEISHEEFLVWANKILDETVKGSTDDPATDIAGQAFAFKPCAFPLVRGEADVGAILVAAELGSGRILLTTEILDFSADFEDNVNDWLTQGSYADSNSQCDITNATELSCLENPAVKMAVWSTTDDYATPESDQTMEAWIKEGGGLFYRVRIQNWYNNEGNDRLWTDLPFYRVLLEAGIGLDLHPAVPNTDDDFVVNKTDVALDVMYGLTLPFALYELQTVADWSDPGPYLVRMIEILETETHKAFPIEVRREIGCGFVEYLEELEPQMEWPSNDGDAAVSSPGLGYLLRLYASLGFLGLWRTKKAYNVEEFPGDKQHDRVHHRKPKVMVNSSSEQYWPTAYYLLPGDEMTITVLSEEEDESWSEFIVMIGIHTDNHMEESLLYRYPRISTKIPLWYPSVTVTSPFGGNIVLLSPPGQSAYIQIELSGVVLAPYCNLNDPFSMRAWAELRMNDAPWAVLHGKHMTFYLPKYGVSSLQSPEPVLTFWDTVVRLDYDLLGTPESARQPMVFVADLQLSEGLMHAGNPIVAHLHYFADPTKDTWPLNYRNPGNHWNIYHEIGHNVQAAEWTMTGYHEVMADLFSMFSMEAMAQLNPLEVNGGWYESSAADGTVVEVITSGDFSLLTSGENPSVALLFYAQLYREFGWGCYREVFSTYAEDKESNPSVFPPDMTDSKKAEEWLSRWNEAVQMNLCPLFLLWGYPVDTACASVTIDPPFLPMDDITDNTEIQTKIDELETQYPNLERNVTTKPDCFIPHMIQKEAWTEELQLQMDEMDPKMELLKDYMEEPHQTDNLAKWRLLGFYNSPPSIALGRLP